MSLLLATAAFIICLGAVRRDYAVVKAQREWVKEHPACAVCGLKRIHG